MSIFITTYQYIDPVPYQFIMTIYIGTTIYIDKGMYIWRGIYIGTGIYVALFYKENSTINIFSISIFTWLLVLVLFLTWKVNIPAQKKFSYQNRVGVKS